MSKHRNPASISELKRHYNLSKCPKEHLLRKGGNANRAGCSWRAGEYGQREASVFRLKRRSDPATPKGQELQNKYTHFILLHFTIPAIMITFQRDG